MLKKKVICLAAAAATIISTISVPTSKAYAATKLISKGDLIQNNDFKAGKGLPWNVVETEPAKSEFEIKDGAYKVTVDSIPNHNKEDRWQVQFRHRGLTLVKGHTYTVSFTVTADHDCKIYPKIGQQGGKYYEFWNGTGEGSGQNTTKWDCITLKAGQKTTVTKTFTFTDRDNSDSSHKEEKDLEMTFHLAGDCAPDYLSSGEKYSYTFHNVSVKDKDFEGYKIDYNDTGYAVRTNQLGYYTNAQKKATVSTTAKSPINWRLVNAKGETVKKGKTKVFGLDHASGDFVHQIDFSDYNEKGTGYKIVLDSDEVVPEHDDSTDTDLKVLAESPKFEIGDGVYSKLRYDAMKYFYHNRSDIPIESKYTDGREDLVRPAGHPHDLMACAEGTWYKENYSLDVTGGWYDAGDHGKYVVNGGISVWTLQNAYERALNSNEKMDKVPYADNSMNIPESGNNVPDILDEARCEIEFMLKMQVPDGKEYAGMVHHKGHDLKWTALALRPDQDPQERFLQPPSTAATLNMAASAAQAARLWEKYDKQFADKCLTASKKAYEAAKKHPNILAPTGGVGGGDYADDKVSDEFYWAACELYATTGDNDYLDDMKTNENYLSMPSNLKGEKENTSNVGCFDWGNVQGLGTLSLLASKNNLPASELKKAKENVTKAADTFVDTENKQGYNVPIQETDVAEGVKGYPWGSNSFVTNTILVLAYANDINSKETNKYLNAANSAMDYLLGNNANTKCYVTGYGTNPLVNPHHRFWSYQADNKFPKAPSGVISGGPNSGLEDPWVKGSGWAPGSRSAAKCYMDNIESWATNECTINWNAPFAWALAYLDDHNNTTNVSVLLGDVNNDGQVDSADFIKLKNFIKLNGKNIKINDKNADVNQDGKINVSDLLALKKLI
ncbi:glycoside hydrolase family 9 protein [Inconstantimicrobium porci]|uniref:glycoside hydrolase family 9 protein n=1 Tax=Inconstantimicrobium porci TaxID=2652291 RepID=UPI0024098EBE|nr:glycoside hydrolase family 9 protein [Inconstantimicrobium porci]MDD6769630.1 glycoside hydrolase family 9 protein [Inconstantimicrobium porci]